MLRKKIRWMTAAGAGAALLVAGCGGGGGGGVSTPASITTDVPVTVIDGAIQNATVCLDRNTNGVCDAGEPTGTTNAAGKVTLKVDNADVGKYPVLAVVGTDAIDADTGPVSTAYTLSAPADRSAVVSPLTTLVHTAIASSGLSSTEAEAVVRSQAGLEISLFADYTQGSDSNAKAAASLAQLVVLVTQQQNSTLASKVGSNDAEGKPISALALRTAVRKAMLESLEALSIAATQPDVLSAADASARAEKLGPKVNALAAGTGLTGATLATVVAVNNQQTAPVTSTTRTPTSGFTLSNLDFTDANNHYRRFLTSSVAQDTLDANGDLRYQDRRYRTAGGVTSTWSAGSGPARNADLAWNGSAWVSCPINFENTSKLRDAQGRSTYTYCGRETGSTLRANLDISGKTLREVYDQTIAGGYTNFRIADASLPLLGTATFPAGSTISYTSGTITSAAPTYYPGRSALPGNGNTVTLASVAAGAGGDATSQPSVACAANNLPFPELATLEEMVERAQGKPCIFGQAQFTYGGVTYRSDVPNVWWNATSVSLGTVGTAPINAGAAPGFYTTNTRLRVAFKGGGTNVTTYYACKERFDTGSSRQCTDIGTGTYTIETLGDARVMRFQNLPAQASALNYTRVFVERGGAIYFGYQNRLSTNSNARLGTIAATALLNQLGLPLPDPEQPLALTAASYQGTWDIWDPVANPTRTDGLSLLVATNGTATCGDSGSSGAFESCALSITNPATGAFTLTAGSATITGTLGFQTGAASGSYNDPEETPPSGSFMGWRR